MSGSALSRSCGNLSWCQVERASSHASAPSRARRRSETSTGSASTVSLNHSAARILEAASARTAHLPSFALTVATAVRPSLDTARKSVSVMGSGWMRATKPLTCDTTLVSRSTDQKIRREGALKRDTVGEPAVDRRQEPQITCPPLALLTRARRFEWLASRRSKSHCCRRSRPKITDRGVSAIRL